MFDFLPKYYAESFKKMMFFIALSLSLSLEFSEAAKLTSLFS